MRGPWDGHLCPPAVQQPRRREAVAVGCAAGLDNGQECPFYDFLFVFFVILIFLYRTVPVMMQRAVFSPGRSETTVISSATGVALPSPV